LVAGTELKNPFKRALRNRVSVAKFLGYFNNIVDKPQGSSAPSMLGFSLLLLSSRAPITLTGSQFIVLPFSKTYFFAFGFRGREIFTGGLLQTKNDH
jgi:hypothetical protein